MGYHQELEAVHEECIHASSVLQFNLFGQHNYECRSMIHLFGRRNMNAAPRFIYSGAIMNAIIPNAIIISHVPHGN